MKGNSLVKVMLLLCLVGVYYGCGKKKGNSDGAGDSVVNVNTSVENGTPAAGNTSFQTFISQVENGNFRARQSDTAKYDYVIYNTAISSGGSSFQLQCTGIFSSWCGSGNAPPTYDTFTRTQSGPNGLSRMVPGPVYPANRTHDIDHAMAGDLATLKVQLANLMREALTYHHPTFSPSVWQMGANVWSFKANGSYYVVDLNLPIAANPRARSIIATGETYLFIQELP